MDGIKIVFMGTPDFAVPSLRALYGAGYDIVAVFCQPDRPKGRSKKPVPCPVKGAALELGLPVHQPPSIKSKAARALLRALAPDYFIVAAFGQLLSQRVLDIAKIAPLNVHASLLPRWRGASPIHFCLHAGDAQTGVAIMKMELALDAGPVYASQAVDLVPGQRRPELEEKLAQVGAQLLLETLPRVPRLTPVPQDESLVTFAPIITKQMGFVDWQEDASAIERKLRAFEGWPGIHCGFRGQPLKILQATPGEPMPGLPPGTIAVLSKKQLGVVCTGGSVLMLHEVQPVGKKPMPIAAFINGYRPTPEDRFQPMPQS